MAHHELLAALHRDFWAYATLVLGDAERRALEESCRKVGVVVPRVGPAPPVFPAAFCSVLKAARAQEGDAFVHHAAYYAGGSAARRVEGNLPHPNTGALRLVAEAAAAFPDLSFESKVHHDARLELTLRAHQALDRAATSYAHGFLKGAATRLNEGSPPAIREAFADGGKQWAATVEWVDAGAKGKAAKGAGRTRRK